MNMPDVIEEAGKGAKPTYRELMDKLANKEIELDAMRIAANSFKQLYEAELSRGVQTAKCEACPRVSAAVYKALLEELKTVAKCAVCAYSFSDPNEDPCKSCKKLKNWKWRRSESGAGGGTKE